MIDTIDHLDTDAQETTDRQQFHIDSDSAAEWLLRRLANIEAEKARITAQAAEMVRQLDSDAQRLRHLYEGELLDYCRRKMAEGGNRRRSCTFLQGTVAFRYVGPSVKVADPAAALVYAQDSGLPAVKTVVTLDAAVYRAEAERHMQETGELLPGVETTPEHETHRLTFGKATDEAR
jgi:phage host-nuclease inhibitor protein Gam